MQGAAKKSKIEGVSARVDTGDWPSAFRARIFLVNRYPKIKDVKSRDGDASVAIEMMSNGRISRNTVHTELKHFCPPR